MALTFQHTGSHTALSGASPATVASGGVNFAVGDYAVFVMAYDNSGGGGADPLSLQIAVTTSSGSFGSAVGGLTGINDPGAASAGLAIRAIAYPFTTAGTDPTFSVSWSGTVVARVIIAGKVTSNVVGGVVGYRTLSTGVNAVAATTGPVTTPSANATEMVVCWTGYEYGAAVTGDSDTTNGSWGSIAGANVGSTTSGMAAYFQAKVVNATGAQTWDPTASVASDWIGASWIFTETLPPAITQAAYRFYADGTETGSTALAAQDTPYTIDPSGGNVNLQLRVRLQSTTAVAVLAGSYFQLQYEKDNSGTWLDADSAFDGYMFGSGSASNLNMSTNAGMAFGQSFMGTGLPLLQADFRMYRSGAGVGTVTAEIYAHTGTFGAGGTGTGTALAVSAAINVSSFGTSAASPRVSFLFDGSFTPVNGTPYVVVAVNSAASSLATISCDNSSGGHPGNRVNRDAAGGTWTATTSDDFYFNVHGPPNTVAQYESANLTDAAATTNRLGAGSGTFVAGKISEDSVVDSHGWTANNYTELLYSLQLIAADLASVSTLKFRVLRNGATTVMTYTAVPTITVYSAPQDRPGTINTQWGWTATSSANVEHSATTTATWAWTASADGVAGPPTVDRPATIATTWALTTSATGVVSHPATTTTSWGTWTASAAATVTRPATVTTTWAWTAAADASVTRPATVTTTWALTTSATGIVTHPATTTATWAWAAAADGVAGPPVVDRPATITSDWSASITGWIATFPAVVTHPATVSTTWALVTSAASTVTRTATVSTTWAWTATAVTAPEKTATVTTTWAWTATATAGVTRPATITTTWAWTATGTTAPEKPATVTTGWGTWTATAAATVAHSATITTTGWGTWTASAAATVTHPATITSDWGTWTGIAIATQAGQGTIASSWGTWTATANGTATRPSTITTTWTWTAGGTGVVGRTATVSTTWGTWTALATATAGRAATISSTFVWAATATGTVTTVVTGIIGQWNGVDVLELMWGAEPVEDWMLV